MLVACAVFVQEKASVAFNEIGLMIVKQAKQKHVRINNALLTKKRKPWDFLIKKPLI